MRPELRQSALAHLPLWLAGGVMAAALMLVLMGGYFLASPRSVLFALTLALAALLGGFGAERHLGRGSSVLARIVWVLTAGCGMLLTWMLYLPFREAAGAELGVSPAEGLTGALVRALAVYWMLSGAIWGVGLMLVVRAVQHWRADAREGPRLAPEGEDSPSFLFRWWQELTGHATGRHTAFGNPPSSPRFSTSEPPLATRDTAALVPRLTFADLVGNAEIKKKLLQAAREWDHGGRKDGKNGILLYGEPGTGKTAFAEALAGELGLRIIKANVGSVASRWVNQTTEQLQDLLESALAQAPCVLFLDEIESLLPDRSAMSHSNAEENKVVGTFLSAVEKLRRGRVLYIGATNYKERVDPAAIREGRFDFHLEMPLPDAEARRGLVLSVLRAEGRTVGEKVLERLVRRWAGFNVPRIQEAARRAARLAGGSQVTMRDFMRALRDVQGNRAGPPESAPSFRDLYFDDAVKDRLTELAATFAHVEEIEARGGTVPKGIIFYGPPGTGKTSMAQALAREAGWTFIATSGKEIATDPDRLRAIRREASDLRPAIVFIDEADDILGDRGYSGLKLHTNDLLRIIDGAGEPLPDVCWILATNRPEELDEAVFRRFPVKIELGLPGADTLRRFVVDWARAHSDKIDKAPEVWGGEVAQALEGLAPSVVKAILQSALDAEAARSVLWDAPMALNLEDVLKARREMAL